MRERARARDGFGYPQVIPIVIHSVFGCVSGVVGYAWGVLLSCWGGFLWLGIRMWWWILG